MRFLPASGAQNPPWQRSGCLHYRIPAQPLSRKLVGEGGCGGILPGQETAPSLECADKNSLPGTFPAGCLCHFRCGLCHGADCSPESTGCDSQLTFSINPLFCGPSSGTSRGTVFFMRRVSAILEPENGGGDDDAEYAAGPGDSGGARLTITPEPGYTVACGFDSPDSVDWGKTLWVWSEKR